MSEGLTRRRGGPASSDAPSSGSNTHSAPSTSAPAPKGRAPVASAGGSGGSGAMEGRAKVAYDPRDFDNSNEEQEQPKLTLMEEVLLLGIKDKAVSRPGPCRRYG